jgi:P27 family predicted phage terminase small subunit
MRGRKPIPTHLKILSGKIDAYPESEPVPKGNLYESPDWFSEDQKSAWDYAIENAPEGLLRRLDKSILTTWVVAQDLHKQAVLEVNKRGLIVKSPVKGEPMQNPWLAIANRQATLMMKASSELGFTPSSRSRVSISNEEQNDSNPFAEFKRG